MSDFSLAYFLPSVRPKFSATSEKHFARWLRTRLEVSGQCTTIFSFAVESRVHKFNVTYQLKSVDPSLTIGKRLGTVHSG